MKNKYSISTKKRSRNRKLYSILFLILAAVLTLAALEATDKTHFFHEPTPTELTGTTISENTKGEKSSTNSSPATTNNPTSKADDSKLNAPQVTGPLVDPTGNFVSSHKVSLSQGGNIASTCNTTPGAQCKIVFIKNGVTKELPVKTVDEGGAAYWNWTLQQVGLDAGKWRVQSTASSGSQKATADDSLELEVSE